MDLKKLREILESDRKEAENTMQLKIIKKEPLTKQYLVGYLDCVDRILDLLKQEEENGNASPSQETTA